MKVRFRFNLQDWSAYMGTSPIQNVVFTHCENWFGINPNIEFTSFTINSLTTNNVFSVSVFANGTTQQFDQSTIGTLVINEDTEFGFDAEVGSTYVDKVLSMWNLGLLQFNLDGRTTIAGYSLQSEKDELNKTIYGRTLFDGKFNHSIGLKNLSIDIQNFNLFYTYVYITSLKRYYYVDSVELISADISRLHLKEDVLMSWQTLIKSQKAFVTRYENSTNKELVDERRPLESVPSVTLLSLTDTPALTTTKNITFNFNLYSNEVPNFIIVGRRKYETNSYVGNYMLAQESDYIHAPVNSLPNIQPHTIPNILVYFMSYKEIYRLYNGLIDDSGTASYLDSVLWLPFNPVQAFYLPSTITRNSFYLGTKFLDAGEHESGGGRFVSENPGTNPYCLVLDTSGKVITQSPYLVAYDGKLTISNPSYLDYEPYSNYEINVPFVGLIKIQAKDIINKRILIYYSMDIRTGGATAYIYNKDDEYIVWSGSCQLGMPVPLTGSNSLENLKTKQSNDLNMLMGLLASAVSIGVGVATENPLAVVGGMMAGTKTIAKNVNANRMLFDRSQVTFGGTDGALFSNTNIFVKKTTNKPLTIHENTYKHLQGLPYNNYVENMNSLTGYVEVGEIHFNPNGYKIFQDEIEEIVQLLQGGVIF